MRHAPRCPHRLPPSLLRPVLTAGAPAPEHSDRVQVTSSGESVKVPTKLTLEYVPFEAATRHSFTKLRPRQLKKETPQLWATLSRSNSHASVV